MTIRNKVELHLVFVLFMAGWTAAEVAVEMRDYRGGGTSANEDRRTLPPAP